MAYVASIPAALVLDAAPPPPSTLAVATCVRSFAARPCRRFVAAAASAKPSVSPTIMPAPAMAAAGVSPRDPPAAAAAAAPAAAITLGPGGPIAPPAALTGPRVVAFGTGDAAAADAADAIVAADPDPGDAGGLKSAASGSGARNSFCNRPEYSRISASAGGRVS